MTMTEHQTGGAVMASRTPAPGTVGVITMGRRPAAPALFDGLFWRSADAHGPIKCAPSAVTSIETPLLYSPGLADA